MSGKKVDKLDARPVMAPFPSAVTRLELLKRGGLTALVLGAGPALVAACGGEEESGGGSGGTTSGAQATGPIDFFAWEGYDLPVEYVPSMEAWKASTDISIRPSYIGSHDDIQAKVKGGGGEGLDLISYYQGYGPLYRELDVIGPIDESKLPNLENLFPIFASDTGGWWVDSDGTRTGVPMFWGTFGINYDSSVVPSAPTSFDDLLDPAYTGKLAIPDDLIAVAGGAAHNLGLEIETMTEDDFAKLKDYLAQMIGQTKGVSPSYGDLTTRLTSGDAVVAWPGWAAVSKFAADAGKDTVMTTLPNEGGFSFVDSYAIPPTSDNVDAAHAWINQALTPETNAEAANYLAGGITVSDAVQFLDPPIAALYGYDDLDAWFERAPLNGWAPIESDEFVTIDRVLSAWQELKATT